MFLYLAQQLNTVYRDCVNLARTRECSTTFLPVRWTVPRAEPIVSGSFNSPKNSYTLIILDKWLIEYHVTKKNPSFRNKSRRRSKQRNHYVIDDENIGVDG